MKPKIPAPRSSSRPGPLRPTDAPSRARGSTRSPDRGTGGLTGWPPAPDLREGDVLQTAAPRRVSRPPLKILREEMPHVPWIPADKAASVSAAWVLGTTGGAIVGALVARTYFPEAVFGRNPVGSFGLHLVAFAGLIGLGIALPQSAILCLVGRGSRARIAAACLLWVPLTVLSVIAMILPLYQVYGGYLVVMPPLLLMLILPGVLLLAAGQWGLLSMAAGMPMTWMLRTSIGVLAGAGIGMIVAAIIVQSAGDPGLMEPVWAGMVGLLLGALQAPVLVREAQVHHKS
jgi:hypothetical protein